MIEPEPRTSQFSTSETSAWDGTAELKGVACVTSESLLGERGELKIQHNGEFYSLRRTRQGKLILTK